MAALIWQCLCAASFWKGGTGLFEGNSSGLGFSHGRLLGLCVLLCCDAPGEEDTFIEILEALHRDPVLPLVSEFRLELPYDLPGEQYQQILTDVAQRVAPELGWRPRQATV